jgi:hypothetical protein
MVVEDNDVAADNDVDDLDEMLRNVKDEFTSKSQNKKFSQIMKDYETSVFLGCNKEHNRFHIVLALLQMKASNGWSDKGFNELLQFLSDLISKINVLPRSTYGAKKMICLLGLEVKKMHACRNDCMLFRKDDAILEECRVCGSSRYKRNNKKISMEMT